MIEYLPLALSSLKTAKDIVATFQDLRDYDKIVSATIELKERLAETIDHIISEKERVSALKERISDLEKENERLKDWSAEKGQYERKAIAKGVFAYMAEGFKGLPQNEYKLCCGCFDKSVKSPLQQGARGEL